MLNIGQFQVNSDMEDLLQNILAEFYFNLKNIRKNGKLEINFKDKDYVYFIGAKSAIYDNHIVLHLDK